MTRFFSLSYLFASPAVETGFRFSKITLIFALALIIGGFAVSYLIKNKVQNKIARKVMRNYGSKLTHYGVYFLILFFFIEVRLPYFSWRIWIVALGIIFLIDVVRQAMKYKPEYEMRQKNKAVSHSHKKYLPKKKKK